MAANTINTVTVSATEQECASGRLLPATTIRAADILARHGVVCIENALADRQGLAAAEAAVMREFARIEGQLRRVGQGVALQYREVNGRAAGVAT